jgi:hypothetical protein
MAGENALLLSSCPHEVVGRSIPNSHKDVENDFAVGVSVFLLIKEPFNLSLST